MSDDFNPDICVPLTVEIEHADGSIEVVPDGYGLELAAGANMALEVDPDDDTIRLSSTSVTASKAGAYYWQKYEALKGLTELNDALNPVTGPYPLPSGVTPVGPPWSFTRLSMWIAMIGDVPGDPLSNAFFLVTTPCSVVGQFTDNSHPETVAARLSIFDICAPCIDCQTFQRLYTYLDRLKVFYTYLFDLVYNADPAHPPVHPDGGVREIANGLLQQYMTCARYWDFCAHGSTVKFSAQAQGQVLVAAAYYKNISDAAVGPVTCDIQFCFFKDGSPYSAINTSNTGTKLLLRAGTDIINMIEAAPPDYTPSCVTAHLVSPGTVPSGGTLYGDLVLLIKSLVDMDASSDYRVIVTATFTGTHIGSVTRTVTIYFQPSEITSSV